MTKVYAFPPVAVQARYWTMEQPVARSRSLLTGATYISAAQRRRILAGFDIAGWPKYSAGYLEALWRYLDGGVNLVRLSSCRIPYGHTVPDELRGERPIDWTNAGAPLPWRTGAGIGIQWMYGADLEGNASVASGYPTFNIAGGLPPNSIVALPGEFLTITVNGVDERHMIGAVATTNSVGAVKIRLVTPASGSGPVSIGTHETGVFEIAGEWPAVMNRLRFPENYGLSFRQVFEDERGPFEEVNPWT